MRQIPLPLMPSVFSVGEDVRVIDADTLGWICRIQTGSASVVLPDTGTQHFKLSQLAPAPDTDELGPSLRRMRLNAGLTPNDLAELLGVGVASIEGVEADQLPPPPHRILMAWLFNVCVPHPHLDGWLLRAQAARCSERWRA